MLLTFSLTAVLLALDVVTAAIYPVKGVSSRNVGTRRNVDELQSEAGPQWDLYIQALSSMQGVNSDDMLSYFQIGGIHGRPFVEWNNTGRRVPGNWGGYCPHGEPIFLSWHRPYLILFEQILVDHARRIANQYPSNIRSRYVQAAEDLRAPWWDWAEENAVPYASVPRSVSIITPSGRRTVGNPLQTYRYPQKALNGAYAAFNSEKPQIVRCDNSKESYPGSANDLLNNRDFKKSVYDAFTVNTKFSEFGTTFYPGASIEQVHNDIHREAACSNSQFQDQGVSGFEPLFMLHHCNMDRLWAYWQAIRPEEANMRRTYEGGPRWSTRRGSTISIDSSLSPFYTNDGSPHTSRSVASIRKFGYTYDQLEYWRKSDDEMKRDATRLINRLYSNSGNRVGLASKRDLVKKKRYFVKIQVKVDELPRPCSVTVYIAGKLIGSLTVMDQPSSGVVNAQFSLDALLQTASPSFIAGMLGFFRVDIVKPTGGRLRIGSAPSLKIQLESVEVTPRKSDDEFPTYSNRHTQTIVSIGDYFDDPFSFGGGGGNLPFGNPVSPDTVSTGQWLLNTIFRMIGF